MAWFDEWLWIFYYKPFSLEREISTYIGFLSKAASMSEIAIMEMIQAYYIKIRLEIVLTYVPTYIYIYIILYGEF